MKPPEYRTRYSPRKRVQFIPSGKSLTQQSLANESDINQIMAKALKTGQAPLPMHERVQQFGDFTKIESFHEAQTAVVHAREQFETLSAKIRARFHNNPEELIIFMEDPANAVEGVKIGLYEALPQKEPVSPPKTEDPPKTPPEASKTTSTS